VVEEVEGEEDMIEIGDAEVPVRTIADRGLALPHTGEGAPLPTTEEEITEAEAGVFHQGEGNIHQEDIEQINTLLI